MPYGEKTIGAIPGIGQGSAFTNRAELSRVGLHRALQDGTTGTAKSGAESIVVSGGYEDDEDYGDVIIYTGHGGRDEKGRQNADQDPSASGNAALITSCLTGAPVRVIRGAHAGSKHAPNSGFRYDGLFRVDSYWVEAGKSGFQVCRYKLISLDSYSASITAEQSALHPSGVPAGNQDPGRRKSTVQRVVRSSAVVDYVKGFYDYQCQ